MRAERQRNRNVSQGEAQECTRETTETYQRKRREGAVCERGTRRGTPGTIARVRRHNGDFLLANIWRSTSGDPPPFFPAAARHNTREMTYFEVYRRTGWICATTRRDSLRGISTHAHDLPPNPQMRKPTLIQPHAEKNAHVTFRVTEKGTHRTKNGHFPPVETKQ